MKISKLTPFVLGTPWRNLTYLKVETDEGLVGISEVRSIREHPPKEEAFNLFKDDWHRRQAAGIK